MSTARPHRESSAQAASNEARRSAPLGEGALAAQLTALPWMAAHGRAERLWQALGAPGQPHREGEPPQPPTGTAWSARAMALAVQWLQEDDLPCLTWQERGRRMLLTRVAARRRAFDARQRQALVISVALDGDRPYPAVHPSRLLAHKPERLAMADGGDTLARGGLLLTHGLSTLSLLTRLSTARDLLLLIEMRAAPDLPAPAGATAIEPDAARDLLAVAACALSDAGGSPVAPEGEPVLPVAVAQKGAAWLRLRGRGRHNDPGLPLPGGATDNLLAALALLRGHERPLRVCPAARAQTLAIAEGAGVTRGLAYRGLLSAATYAQAVRHLGGAAPMFDALLHDTWTVTRVQTDGRPDAAGGDAWALLDCRLVPGRDAADLVAELEAIVGERVQIDVLAERSGKSSDLHAQLLRVLTRTLQARVPGTRMVPRLQLAGCDAWGWRQRAVPCFGFAPIQVPVEVDVEPLWQRGAVPTLAAERAWGRSVFVEATARYLVDA